MEAMSNLPMQATTDATEPPEAGKQPLHKTVAMLRPLAASLAPDEQRRWPDLMLDQHCVARSLRRLCGR